MAFNRSFISQNFLAIVVTLQVAMYLTLFLNFSLARIVIGIAYLTFIPGYIMVRLLKIGSLSTLESILYSVAFSIAFLMAAGGVINQFGSLIGITFPLATLPISLFINTIVIIGAAVVYLQQKPMSPIGQSHTPFKRSMLLLVLIPIISIIGAYFVNVTGNNFILLIMILSIVGLFIGSFYSDKLPKSQTFYAFAIAMIALALLMHVSLMSNYILPYGGDSPVELYVFRGTQLGLHWDPVFMIPSDEAVGRYNAMLSITILPTVYSNMLGLDATWVFKIIYPLIFAMVPVGLYLLWQPYIGKRLSFAAAFLFMAQMTFFTEMLALNRQMIAELFFVMLLLLLLNKKVPDGAKFAGFAVLSFGLIVSHYALAEIFLFLILAAWAVSKFYIRKPSFNLQLSFVVFFFVAMFLWYIYSSGAVVFDSFISFTSYVTGQLGEFFNPASRGQAVLTGLGLAESPSILNTVSRGIAYITELFIIIGVIALFTHRKMPFRFERDYVVFSVLTVVFLALLTLVPGLANTLSMTRFYHILLMILAPFCIVGMWMAVHILSRRRREMVFSLLVIAVLVPYFLFQTNFVYEVAGSQSWSIPLSGYRMDPVEKYGAFGYIDGSSVYGANWVDKYVPYQYKLLSDTALYTSLTAYGLVYRGYMTELRDGTILNGGEYVFLSYLSLNYEPLVSNGTIPRLLDQTDVVYSNSNSEVHYAPHS